MDKMIQASTRRTKDVEDNSTAISHITDNTAENDATKSNGRPSSDCGSYPNLVGSQIELCPNMMTKDKMQKFPKSDLDDNSNETTAKSNEKVEKEYTGMKRYWGMILAVASSFSLSLVNLNAKILPEYGFESYGISFWRYVGIGLPALPMLLFCEYRNTKRANFDLGKGDHVKNSSIFDTVWPIMKNDNWKTWIALIIRGIMGSTSAILRFQALKYLTIGDTSVIAYASPALVTILAHFLLGEKCGLVPIIISLTTIIGVVVIARPPLLTGADSFDTDTMIGISLASGSLFCAAFMVIITRKIREVHFALMLVIFGVIGIVQALIMSHTLGHGHLDIPSQMKDSLLSAGVALFSFLGQLGVILAVKFEKAGPVALLRSNDVIFSFILQFIFLGVAPHIYSALGAVIVLTGVLVIAARKWIPTLPSQSKKRKYFGWVLY